MNKKYLFSFLFLFISSFIYQCKKKKEDPDPENLSISTIPCSIASISADGNPIVTFELIKDDQGKIMGRQINYVPFQLGSRKSVIDYNGQGQKIKEQFYDLPTNQASFYIIYEYNNQGQLIVRKTYPVVGQPTIEKLEYAINGQLQKIWQSSANSSVYANLIYDEDLNLIKVDWCDSTTKQCSTIESYEYDKTKMYVPIPEPFVLPFLVDFTYGKHFCIKKNIYSTNGEINSSINFKIEESNTNGYPTAIAIYPSGATTSSIYRYNYDCK